MRKSTPLTASRAYSPTHQGRHLSVPVRKWAGVSTRRQQAAVRGVLVGRAIMAPGVSTRFVMVSVLSVMRVIKLEPAVAMANATECRASVPLVRRTSSMDLRRPVSSSIAPPQG